MFSLSGSYFIICKTEQRTWRYASSSPFQEGLTGHPWDRGVSCKLPKDLQETASSHVMPFPGHPAFSYQIRWKHTGTAISASCWAL